MRAGVLVLYAETYDCMKEDSVCINGVESCTRLEEYFIAKSKLSGVERLSAVEILTVIRSSIFVRKRIICTQYRLPTLFT
jgi:hypothetical protein